MLTSGLDAFASAKFERAVDLYAQGVVRVLIAEQPGLVLSGLGTGGTVGSRPPEDAPEA